MALPVGRPLLLPGRVVVVSISYFVPGLIGWRRSWRPWSLLLNIMVGTHLGAVALRWSLAGTLLAACHGATTTPTVSAPPPGKKAPMAAQKVAAAPDSAAPPAAAGQPVPFVGRPGVGAVIRAAEANAETH